MTGDSWNSGKPFDLRDLRRQIDQAEQLGIELDRHAGILGVDVRTLHALAKLTPEEVGVLQDDLEHLDVPSARLLRPDLESARARHN